MMRNLQLHLRAPGRGDISHTTEPIALRNCIVKPVAAAAEPAAGAGSGGGCGAGDGEEQGAGAGATRVVAGAGARARSPERHVCPECSRGFPWLWVLKGHMRSHRPQSRRLQCGECGYEARDDGDFVLHRRVHTWDRSFRRDDCRFPSMVRRRPLRKRVQERTPTPRRERELGAEWQPGTAATQRGPSGGATRRAWRRREEKESFLPRSKIVLHITCTQFEANQIPPWRQRREQMSASGVEEGRKMLEDRLHMQGGVPCSLRVTRCKEDMKRTAWKI